MRTPKLIVTQPEWLQGKELTVPEGSAVVGRSATSDLCLDEPHVSRDHAQIRRQGQRTVIEDLGSSAGTVINGLEVRGPTFLRDGDLLRFGLVEVRYEENEGREMATAALAVVPGSAQGPPQGHRADYEIGSQRAENINNVGGNQYIQEIHEQRESFLREIAAIKTRATWLIVLGFGMLIGGGGTYGWAILSFITKVDQVSSSGVDSGSFNAHLFGRSVGGVPIGVIGFAVAFMGQILIIVGVVFRIIAAARRRRLDRTLPLPWTQASRAGYESSRPLIAR